VHTISRIVLFPKCMPTSFRLVTTCTLLLHCRLSVHHPSPAGTVHAISRGVLFIKCMELMDRGGFLVVRNRQVRVRGGTAGTSGAGGLGGPVPASVLASPQHAPGAGPQNPFAAGGRGGGGGRDGGFGRGGGRHGGRGGGSALLGQELRVRSGAYAGYKGRVKQETATHMQVRKLGGRGHHQNSDIVT
jgi:transcription elongation factor SPT5